MSTSATTLTISPRRVREINDPILEILELLHQLIYITQVGTKTTIYTKYLAVYILNKVTTVVAISNNCYNADVLEEIN